MRRPNDFYPTPAQLTKELLKRVVISGTVFECCAGDGAIAKELKATHLNSLRKSKIKKVFTNDIVEHNCDCDFQENATFPENWKDNNWQYDWVITNPPFTRAPDIIPLAWDNCHVGIAMLLRLTYLEPAGNRGEWLQENSKYLTDLIIFGQPRPSFTENGSTDHCTTAWFIWQKAPSIQSGTKLHFVYDWKK
ncbi:hypothetical protein [Floridanema evergladense]|uniref:Site-specific DNA-methyltransferase (adenine-specific) n=1 Tax=Floridaenema evergladense BLCC-F167 TaxID=3153639 RepID=A0ABV4WCX1_9CYAN